MSLQASFQGNSVGLMQHVPEQVMLKYTNLASIYTTYGFWTSTVVPSATQPIERCCKVQKLNLNGMVWCSTLSVSILLCTTYPTHKVLRRWKLILSFVLKFWVSFWVMKHYSKYIFHQLVLISSTSSNAYRDVSEYVINWGASCMYVPATLLQIANIKEL